MPKRTDQVASVLQRAITAVITRGLSDPRMDVPALTSVTKVDVSPDLKQAKVFVTVTPDQYERRIVAALGHSAGHISRQVGQQVRLRTIPRLTFALDESLKKEARVLADIHEAMDRTGPDDEGDPPPPGDDDHASDPDRVGPDEST